MHNNEVETMWNKMKNDVNIVRDKFIKRKTRIKNKCKWVTKKVTRLRRAKKKAWMKYVKGDKDELLFENYKKKLKLSTEHNKEAKHSYEVKLAENIKNDIKSFYAYVSNKARSSKKIGPLKDATGQIILENKTAATCLISTSPVYLQLKIPL